jgi:hypothetical protein
MTADGAGEASQDFARDKRYECNGKFKPPSEPPFSPLLDALLPAFWCKHFAAVAAVKIALNQCNPGTQDV